MELLKGSPRFSFKLDGIPMHQLPYPLTAVNTELDIWCATQFDRPSQNDGVLLIFRRENSPCETAKFRLFNIDEHALYAITDADGGTWTDSGKELADGLTVSVSKREAKILFYAKQREGI